MSGTQRRNSKSRAAAMRRERSELRPPVTGQRGIGRASLPARLTAPMMVANDGPAEPTPNPPGDEARRAAVGADHDSSVEAMQVEEAGQKKDKQTNRSKENDDATWTPEMLEKAAREILGDDKQLQFRLVLQFRRAARQRREKRTLRSTGCVVYSQQSQGQTSLFICL